MIAIQTKADIKPNLLKNLRARTEPSALVKVGARAAANETREHLFELDRSKINRLGGKRTHFFGQAARAVQTPTLHTGLPGGAAMGRFEINHVGLAQRLLGGRLQPVRTKYLTIPARAEAYGKSAREFKDLHFVPTRTGGALVQNLQSIVRRTKTGFKSGGTRGGGVMFWLVKQVNQAADPSVMPSDEKLSSVVSKAMAEHVSSNL